MHQCRTHTCHVCCSSVPWLNTAVPASALLPVLFLFSVGIGAAQTAMPAGGTAIQSVDADGSIRPLSSLLFGRSGFRLRSASISAAHYSANLTASRAPGD